MEIPFSPVWVFEWPYPLLSSLTFCSHETAFFMSQTMGLSRSVLFDLTDSGIPEFQAKLFQRKKNGYWIVSLWICLSSRNLGWNGSVDKELSVLIENFPWGWTWRSLLLVIISLVLVLNSSSLCIMFMYNVYFVEHQYRMEKI